jgi:hypothetical protein
MPNPAHQFVVKGTAQDGRTIFWTAAMGGRYPEFLRDRARAYAMTEHGAVDVATRFNVGQPLEGFGITGLAGYTYSAEPYVLPV